MLGRCPNANVSSSLGLELAYQEDEAAHAPGKWVSQGGDAVIDPAG